VLFLEKILILGSETAERLKRGRPPEKNGEGASPARRVYLCRVERLDQLPELQGVLVFGNEAYQHPSGKKIKMIVSVQGIASFGSTLSHSSSPFFFPTMHKTNNTAQLHG
jgi:hypothetical protein